MARSRAGLEPADVARAVGLNKPSYYDLESHDDEVTSNISLGTLTAIAQMLGTTTVELLNGPQAVGPTSRKSPSVLAGMARTRIASEGLTVDAYGDRIGWDIAPVLANPEHVWKYPFDMLQALCDDLGVDWKDFIDGQGPPSPSGSGGSGGSTGAGGSAGAGGASAAATGGGSAAGRGGAGGATSGATEGGGGSGSDAGCGCRTSPAASTPGRAWPASARRVRHLAAPTSQVFVTSVTMAGQPRAAADGACVPPLNA